MPSKTKITVEPESCEYCDGGIVSRTIRVPFHYKGSTIYIDNAPVRVCSRCGEIYFPAEVYKRLEKIAENRKRIRSKVSFPLADYRIA